MSTSIRAATMADAAAIAELMPHLGYTASPTQVASRLAPLLASPSHAVLLAEVDGTVVGLCMLAGAQHLASDGFAEVVELVVHEACQGRGLGRLLMAQAQAWAAHRGYTRVRLRSGVQRTEAHRFYEHLGYAKSRASYAFERTLDLPDRPAAGAAASAVGEPMPRAADAVGTAGGDRATQSTAPVAVREAPAHDTAAIQRRYGQPAAAQADGPAAARSRPRRSCIPQETSMQRRSLPAAILKGGLLGGALDLAFALTFAATQGALPTRVLQAIASGLLGSAAFTGGTASAALGLLCHFALSVLWAALLAAMASRQPALLRSPWWAAIGFGLVVFLSMRLLVLPLSAYPRPVSFRPLASVLDLSSHVLLFALPMVLVLRGALGGRDAAAPGGEPSARAVD